MFMKPFFILLLSFFYLPGITWHNNMDEARQLAKQEHKYILLNFSGSDWCGPCIRLHKDVFGTTVFQDYSATNLVLVNADFPRLKRNQLPVVQQKINDAIAERYNSKGSFPLTLLLNDDGNVLKEWEGFPRGTVDEFVAQIQFVIDHNQTSK
jgi:thioredoxin-related protein